MYQIIRKLENERNVWQRFIDATERKVNEKGIESINDAWAHDILIMIEKVDLLNLAIEKLKK